MQEMDQDVKKLALVEMHVSLVCELRGGVPGK